MKSQLGGLRRKFMGNHLITTEAQNNKITDRQKEDNVIEWLTFYQYRRNWHIYVDEVLQIKLKFFQVVMIYLMGISDVFWAICARGLSKTFVVSLGCIVKMNLYPYSEIVVTSSTVNQANKLVEDKLRDELIKKLSPYLLYMYEHEYIVITKPEDGYRIENKLNGSVMRVMPCLDSSRGPRATFLVYEEARLLKKGMIDSVFEKMAHPRQAKYLTNPEYANNPRWKEECQHIYITSARFKFEWFWNLFKSTFTRHFTDKYIRNNIFAGDIFLSIDNGLKTWGDYRNGLAGGEMDFEMEDLNVMRGENEDSFFNLQSFVKNQTIQNAFRPWTPQQIAMQQFPDFPQKKPREVRLVVADFSFTEITTNGNESDNTIFICMRGVWNRGRFKRYLDYIEQFPPNHDEEAVIRLKELYISYDADYISTDARNGGENVVVEFSKIHSHPEWGGYWIDHGFTMADEKYVHITAKEKLDWYRQRCIDKQSVRCLVPFLGSLNVNTAYWRSTKRVLENGWCELLCSMQDRRSYLEESGKYYDLTSEQYAEDLAPYAQTDMLIEEAINLQADYKNGIRLTAPKGKHRDRIVTFGMGNYILDSIENEWNKQDQDKTIDFSNVQLVW